jgi:signal peptidase I
MAESSANSLRPSPWLTIWLRPRNTIERILAGNPKYHVLRLAVLASASTIVSQFIANGLVIPLLDWRVIASVALGGVALCFAGFYLSALFLRWIGNLLGGRASTVQLFAALAWGSAPRVLGLAICALALAGLELSGAKAGDPASATFVLALQAVSGGIILWTLVTTMLTLGRTQHFGFWRTSASIALLLLLSATIAGAIRTALFQPFDIPSRSMEPTLLVGDHFFVSKFSYGYSHYSLPFSPPLFSSRIFASEPRRGDVVVFRAPSDDSIDYVKRLIGLPGDRIQMINGVLQINGQPVARERIDDFVEIDENGRGAPVKQWRQTLPNGVTFTTINLEDNGFYANTPIYAVPPGNYFVMGDNTDNSNDSRVGQFGYIPFENLIGRVEIIHFSVERRPSTNWATIRFERIGKIVR